jgi:hypothetical protein
MAYATPELTSIGRATGVVLGGAKKTEWPLPDADNKFCDPNPTSDTEW